MVTTHTKKKKHTTRPPTAPAKHGGMDNPLDFMGKLRRHQQLMVRDDGLQEKFVDIMSTMYVQRSGNICPPWPDMVDPVDRINFTLFWGMARLIQEMTLEMRRRHPDSPPISEDTLVDCLSQAPTEQNARENPVFELLVACLDHT